MMSMEIYMDNYLFMIKYKILACYTDAKTTYA